MRIGVPRERLANEARVAAIAPARRGFTALVWHATYNLLKIGSMIHNCLRLPASFYIKIHLRI